MARSKTEERELLTQLRVLIGNGKSDYECMEALGVTMSTLQSLKRQLFSDELDNTSNETAAENWVRYHLKMIRCIEDLDEVIERAQEFTDTASALSSTVGAIKAKADLVDRVFDRGQALGVIPTAPPPDSEDGKGKSAQGLNELVRQKERMLEEAAQRYGVKDLAEIQMGEEDFYQDFEDDEDATTDEEVDLANLTPGDVRH